MRVISFSLWGDNPAFFNGALANLELAKQYYPGWECYFFIPEDFSKDWADDLCEAGGTINWVPNATAGWSGLFWRFAPIHYPDVTHTVVRDCDSRLNPREAAAVNEWLQSGQLFHVMRDHIEHQTAIMGGMFGCRYWPLFEFKLKEWTDRFSKGSDQVFLAEKIWPLVKHKTLGHDRYPNGIDWPSEPVYRYRPMDFFGLHTLKPFPIHEPLNPAIHGEHVGARVGL